MKKSGQSRCRHSLDERTPATHYPLISLLWVVYREVVVQNHQEKQGYPEGVCKDSQLDVGDHGDLEICVEDPSPKQILRCATSPRRLQPCTKLSFSSALAIRRQRYLLLND
uniref:Uncharacterized protein n=1 Tax=Rhipicephalus zambeziensis TaxID=60191 RepID=A0A224YGN0_9ACAR